MLKEQLRLLNELTVTMTGAEFSADIMIPCGDLQATLLVESHPEWRERLKPIHALTERSMFPKPRPDKITIVAPLLGSWRGSEAFQDIDKLELESDGLSTVMETTEADTMLCPWETVTNLTEYEATTLHKVEVWDNHNDPEQTEW